MAVKPDPPSTTASTYNSDCILDIGQVPRLPIEYEPEVIYDELLDVHNALEALAECAGTDDCYCIELCDAGGCKVYECDAIQSAFDTIDTLYFVSRGYASDVVGTVASNIAVATPYPSTGSFNGITTALTDNPLGQCSDENIFSWNSSSKLSHPQTYPDYSGLVDDNWMGGLFWPGNKVEGGNALRSIASFDWPTYVYNLYDIRWNPDNGYIEFISGDKTDNNVLVKVGATVPELKSFDGSSNPRWVFIAWKLFKTNSSITVDVYANGVQVISLHTTTTVSGLSISTRSWWETEDGAAGARTPEWGASSGLHSSFIGEILYSFIAPPSFKEESLLVMQDGFERQMKAYTDPDPDCSIDSFPLPENNQGLIYRSAGISEITGEEEGCWDFACMPEVCCESVVAPVEGQVLKATETSNLYCAEDIYPAGSANQVLTRNSDAPDDVAWSDAGTAAGGSVIFSPYDPDPVATGTFWVTGGY